MEILLDPYHFCVTVKHMDNTDCVIYVGSCFTMEWYYDSAGKSKVYEYFLGISAEQKRKFLILVKKVGDFGKIYDKTKFRHEGDGIYAFKPKPDRYLSFFTEGKKIIVLHAFVKKSQKMPTKEKEIAIKLRQDYNDRNGVKQ